MGVLLAHVTFQPLGKTSLISRIGDPLTGLTLSPIPAQLDLSGSLFPGWSYRDLGFLSSRRERPFLPSIALVSGIGERVYMFPEFPELHHLCLPFPSKVSISKATQNCDKSHGDSTLKQRSTNKEEHLEL